MALLETAFSIFSLYPYPSSSSSNNRFQLSPKRQDTSIKLHLSNTISPPFSRTAFSASPLPSKNSSRKLFSKFCFAFQELPIEEKSKEIKSKAKLFVYNLPWTFSVMDIKNLFGQCGAVTDIEVIKEKDGRGRGFAFVTMASGEEAQAAIHQFDSQEISGRTIRVELARRLKKPPPQNPPGPPAGEARHKVYVSNLAWKVRSTNRENSSLKTSSQFHLRLSLKAPREDLPGMDLFLFLQRRKQKLQFLH